MRRTIATAITVLALAACSPYDTPADASPAPTTTCDRACWEAITQRQRNERAWWAEVVRQQQARAAWARLLAHLEAQRAEAARRTGGAYVQGIEVCNGRTLPTCGIVRRESRFNPNIWNTGGSGAWGLYQFLRSTWRATCPEYPHGSASVAQQVECARRLWNGGRGRGHWGL